MKKYTSYKDAGVDVDAGNEFVKRIVPLVRATHRPEVHTELGGFSGLFNISNLPYKNPMLVSSTDGVGTKLNLAFMSGIHNTVGIDLVAMSVNDIAVNGAEPLFFLDYFACGKLDSGVAADVVEGIAKACKETKCALLGGETAEMPDFYPPGHYDLAGFVVGVVDNDRLVDGSSINVSNKIIGVASSGLHSNGYSLVRKIIFDQLELKIDDKVEGFRGTVAEELLTPTRLYSNTTTNLIRDFSIGGFAHITGGGLIDNLPRVIPDRCKAKIYKDSWEVPYIFEFLQEEGGVAEREMLRTFNMGVGLCVICRADDAETVLGRLHALGEKAWVIGEITNRNKNEEKIEFE